MPNTSFILIHIEEKSNFRFNTGKKHSINIKDILFIISMKSFVCFYRKASKDHRRSIVQKNLPYSKNLQ
jgi:hypothetical protein